VRIFVLTILGFSASALAAAPQPITADQAYTLLRDACNKSVLTGRFTADMQASITEGGRSPVAYRSALDVGLNTFKFDSFIDGSLALTCVGDAKKVWRYDPARNEFAYLSQPADLKTAFGIVSAWTRNENQRFVRLFAVGIRWMAKPTCTYDAVTGELDMQQLTAGGNNWRGTLATFMIDTGNGRLNTMSIDERLDIPKVGLRVVQMDVSVDYQPGPLPQPYTFSIPQGAKPAMDMPSRGG